MVAKGSWWSRCESKVGVTGGSMWVLHNRGNIDVAAIVWRCAVYSFEVEGVLVRKLARGSLNLRHLR